MAVSVPFTTHIRSSPDTREHVERDRDRSDKFITGISPYGPTAKQRSENYVDSIDVSYSSVTYTISVGVGNPQTKHNLLVEVASCNTWIGANIPYKPTSTSTSTGKDVKLEYRDGGILGKEYTDRVTLGEGLVVQNQLICVAGENHGFDTSDGVLGIGPIHFTRTTPSNPEKVPTIIDNLYSQGSIPSVSWGIFYEPPTDANFANGMITFGGTDATKHISNFNYVPITSTPPASHYWGIEQSVDYGDNTILNTTSGIVDISTTFLLLATKAFHAYQEATGAVVDSASGLLTITEEQYEKLQSLFFNIGGVRYELKPNAQIWPRAHYNSIRGQEGRIYLVVAELGTIGSGLDFILGYTWLQRFYTHFDIANSRIGFATTSFTNAETDY